MKKPVWIWILWPSFLIAGIAEIVFFTVFDPVELHMVAQVFGMNSRLAWYTIGFFLFWLFAAASSAFTYFLQRGSSEASRR